MFAKFKFVVLRELPPTEAHWKKLVQPDTDPLDAIDRHQQLAPCEDRSRFGEPHDRAIRESVEMVFRHGHCRSTEEVTNQFRRVVPACVLEVEKCCAPIGRDDGVMKAESEERYIA